MSRMWGPLKRYSSSPSRTSRPAMGECLGHSGQSARTRAVPLPILHFKPCDGKRVRLYNKANTEGGARSPFSEVGTWVGVKAK